MHTESAAPTASAPATTGRETLRAAVVVGALGVVFGDIGTSPIYTIQTVFNPADPHPVPVSTDNVFGVVSLIFWSVMIIVTVTYVALVMRASNEGEGGIMALITLLRRWGGDARSRRRIAVLASLGIFGAALFFGDSMITPAISVLSAVEGVKVVEPALEELVVPLTAVIIVLLFAVQRRGTAAVGRLFGPVMIVWFVAIGACGVAGIVAHPEILKALSPTYAVGFLAGNFGVAFFALAAVVLAVTGAEALYADMGHFGRRAITRGWLGLVLPACTLSYFGQGALILGDPSTVSSPFFLLTPEWGRLPMILLATAATVIASQAVITGAFSVAAQAAQLGYLPRLRIAHTSESTIGQIYVPWVNWMLAVAVAHAGVRLPQLGRARLRVRHGGGHDDHHHDAAVLLPRPGPLADPALAGGARRRRPAGGRPAVPRGEPHQARARRVAAAAHRPRRVRGDDDLAARPGDRHPRAGARGGPAARVRRPAARRGSPRSCRSRAPRSSSTAASRRAPLAMRANVEHNHVRHEHVVILSIETRPVPRVPERRAHRDRRARLRRRRHRPRQRALRLHGDPRRAARARACSTRGRPRA